jgi:2-keto-4-pentenoate hydratase/2-oxohepta-3-ene-1,7-dioic acid hydratase in catechol pathway
MKVIRYQDSQGHTHIAADGNRIAGDIFGQFTVTDEPAEVHKLLAPLVPVAILCIGANYRRLIEETGHQAPEYPVLFIKQPAAIQNPGDPVLLPTCVATRWIKNANSPS